MSDPQAARALTEALWLVEHGYQLTPVTITRDPNGEKRARFHKGWRHEDAWSNDPDQVRAWWVDHPDTSFAVRTGAAGGVDVIDLDVKDGKDGVAWWAEQGHPLGSVVVCTPSGGLHLYVPACGLPTVAGQFGPGVDTRGDGGLVFAPGAYVVGEGGHYEVQGPLVRVADLAPLPDELTAAIRAAAPESAQYRADGAITMKDFAVAVQLTRAAVEKVAAMPPGTAGSLFRDAQMGAAMMLGRLAEAGCDPDWAREQIEAATLAVWPNGLSTADERNITSGLRDGPRKERWRWRNPTSAASSGEGAAEPELVDGGLLPRETWNRSAVLHHIYRAALATLTCPDAVLHSVLAIIASHLHHGSRVKTGVRPSVLSYYVAAIGASGGGKSEALSVARDLLEQWCEGSERFAIHGGGGYYDGPVGSGEGLVEAFMGETRVPVIDLDSGEQVRDPDGNPRTAKARGQARHNALFHSDEGRQVLAIDSRKGATVLAVLCEMWSGSVAGQTNADKDRTRKLGRGTYVLGLLLGFQPATIDSLFADESGGAPQRFAFVPVAYPPHAQFDEFVEWPGPLRPDIPASAVTVELKAEYRAEVRTHRRLKAAGILDEANPLDGHRMLLRVRTAALLALLHGGDAVDDELWELSGLMVDRSCALRDHLAGQARRRAQEVRRARQDEAVELSGRASAADEYRTRVQRAADSLVRFLEKHGETARGTAKAGITSSVRRTHGDAAIEKLISEGVVTECDGRLVLS